MEWIEIIIVAALAGDALNYLWLKSALFDPIQRALDNAEGWVAYLLQCGFCLAYHLGLVLTLVIAAMIVFEANVWYRVPFYWLASVSLMHLLWNYRLAQNTGQMEAISTWIADDKKS